MHGSSTAADGFTMTIKSKASSFAYDPSDVFFRTDTPGDVISLALAISYTISYILLDTKQYIRARSHNSNIIHIHLFRNLLLKILKMLLGLLYLVSGAALVQAAVHHSKRQLNFKPAAQPIDVHNAHAFIAPGLSDLRGPCPALNALANHGYVARNGYTNFQESLNAVIQVYGAGEFLNLRILCLPKTTTDRIGLSQVLTLLLVWLPWGPCKLVMVTISQLAVRQDRAFLSQVVY